MANFLGSLLSQQYTISDLMAIDAERQQRASACNVTFLGIIHEIKPESITSKLKQFFTGNHQTLNVYSIILKFRVVSDTGNTHNVVIKCSPDYDGYLGMNNKVQIFCTCRDFVFRSAYILQQHSSLFRSPATDMRLGTAITDAPKKNHKTSLLCKHAFAALTYFQNNYQSIMSSL